MAAISCVSEEVCTFGWLEGQKGLGSSGFESFDGSSSSLSDVGLEFGKGVLDGIEIRAVGRQIEKRRPARFDSLPDAVDLVGCQIVHDDDVAWPKGRCQHLLTPGPEDLTIHWPIEQHRGDEASNSQATDEGHGLPVAVRDRGETALTFRRPTT